MSRYNADIAVAPEREAAPQHGSVVLTAPVGDQEEYLRNIERCNQYDQSVVVGGPPARSAVPAGFALYLGDIQDSLLTASAASDAMIQAKFDGDLAVMAQNCAVVLAETRSAAALALLLGKHLSAHRRRHEGGARQ